MVVRISITEAKRNLGKIYRCTRQGHSFVVTRYGTPIAYIAPTQDAAGFDQDGTAMSALMARLQSLRTERNTASR